MKTTLHFKPFTRKPNVVTKPGRSSGLASVEYLPIGQSADSGMKIQQVEGEIGQR